MLVLLAEATEEIWHTPFCDVFEIKEMEPFKDAVINIFTSSMDEITSYNLIDVAHRE